MIVDSDVLIWHLRGYSKATQRLDQLSSTSLSAITYLELVQGVRNKAEMVAVQKSLTMRQASILPLTPAITARATILMEGLTLSHGLQLADALIAATALEHDLDLLTANTKHYLAISGLRLERFEP